MNSIGLICAITTLLNIWLGHVIVRRFEAQTSSIRLPIAIFVCAGLALVTAASLSTSLPISAILGITGVISFWDAFEFVRQERRVIQGHAPANPLNPRHQRILAAYPSASSIDWLDREPIGRPISDAEIKSIRDTVK